MSARDFHAREIGRPDIFRGNATATAALGETSRTSEYFREIVVCANGGYRLSKVDVKTIGEYFVFRNTPSTSRNVGVVGSRIAIPKKKGGGETPANASPPTPPS